VLVDALNAPESAGVKTAVIECVAADKLVVVYVAVPLVTVTGLPNVAVPSMNCTEPAAVGVTVAVKVTDVPAVIGLAGFAVTAVVVAVGPEPDEGGVNVPSSWVQVLPLIMMSALA
jgi:hypothetical protein